MKFSYKSLYLLVLATLILSGCSRKKDKFLNKGFHSMTTKYNYLYNGNNLLNQGKAEINENVFDNYWEILPIEKTQITEDKINLKLKKEQRWKAWRCTLLNQAPWGRHHYYRH